MLAYKLFRKRKDGTLGSLFINRCQVIVPNVWLVAGAHRTKGYTFRPGWHCCAKPVAPHLKKEGRVWCLVEINGWQSIQRPASQGSLWYLAQCLKLLKELPHVNRHPKP